MSAVNFDGIFNFYHTHYPNTAIKKLVKVKTSSEWGGRGDPYYVIDPNISSSSIETNWLSDSIENSSYMVIFQRDLLQLTSYSLRSRLDKNYNTPKEWILEGSNDQRNWKFLHHKERGNELIDKGSEGNWTSNVNEFFRMFRLTMLGENKMGNSSQKYVFSLNKFEVFGKLKPYFSGLTCKAHHRYNKRTELVLLFVLIS